MELAAEGTGGVGGGLYLDGLALGDRSLARLGDVSGLVNRFAGGVFLLRAAWHGGDPDAADPLARIGADARAAGDIIMGRNPEWAAQPWNKPERLGWTIRALLPDETRHFGDPGEALFMWLASQVIAIAQSVESSQLSEASAKIEVKRVADDVAARIMGIR